MFTYQDWFSSQTSGIFSTFPLRSFSSENFFSPFCHISRTTRQINAASSLALWVGTLIFNIASPPFFFKEYFFSPSCHVSLTTRQINSASSRTLWLDTLLFTFSPSFLPAQYIISLSNFFTFSLQLLELLQRAFLHYKNSNQRLEQRWRLIIMLSGKREPWVRWNEVMMHSRHLYKTVTHSKINRTEERLVHVRS